MSARRRQEAGDRRPEAAAGFRCLLLLTAVVLAPGGVPAQTPDPEYPVFTDEHLDATMKTLGPNVAGVRAALATDDLTLAKERVIRAREQLAPTITFWRDHGRDDAVDLLRTVLRAFDALDVALSRDPVDRVAVETRTAEVSAGCAACHAVYREEGPGDGEYRVRQSALR